MGQGLQTSRLQHRDCGCRPHPQPCHHRGRHLPSRHPEMRTGAPSSGAATVSHQTGGLQYVAAAYALLVVVCWWHLLLVFAVSAGCVFCFWRNALGFCCGVASDTHTQTHKAWSFSPVGTSLQCLHECSAPDVVHLGLDYPVLMHPGQIKAVNVALISNLQSQCRLVTKATSSLTCGQCRVPQGTDCCPMPWCQNLTSVLIHRIYLPPHLE